MNTVSVNYDLICEISTKTRGDIEEQEELINQLIKENPDATISDYLSVVI